MSAAARFSYFALYSAFGVVKITVRGRAVPNTESAKAPKREPLWNRTSMVDYIGGFLGAVSAVAALYHRARTGEGSTLSCALLNAGIYLLSQLVQRPDGKFEGGELLNASRTGFRPSEALYEAADGWIAVVARGSDAGAALAVTLGLELPADPLAWGDAEAAAISGALKARTCDAAITALESAGVWVELCRQNAEHKTLNDLALRDTGTVRVSIHPQYGEVRELGPMLRFSRSTIGAIGHAPLLGESSREILAEIGISEAEIDKLWEQKVVT